MAHRLLRNPEADGWERSDFPIICESCLGDNPYIRMTRAEYDKECKICSRPFTVFRWRPGRDARYKKTEICQTCCKLKNVCQVCLLDLEYGLPVQVRDSALAIDSNDSIPRSDVNREFFAEEHDRRTRAGLDYESSYGKVRPNDTILKLQRTEPYYKRNRAHVCSFYIRGECTRGAECPYRHEMPVTGELSQQNIKDRYYGVNDPVAMMLLNKAGEMPSLEPPEDESIRTLYVGGIDARISEQDLRDHFYAHGEIESIRMVLQKACAFVTYTTREGAEKAAEELYSKLVVKGLRLKLLWGRPQATKVEPEGANGATQQALAHGGLLPRAVISQQHNQLQQDQYAPVHFYHIPPPPSQERTSFDGSSKDGCAHPVPGQDPQCLRGLARRMPISIGSSIMHFKLRLHFKVNIISNFILLRMGICRLHRNLTRRIMMQCLRHHRYQWTNSTGILQHHPSLVQLLKPKSFCSVNLLVRVELALHSEFSQIIRLLYKKCRFALKFLVGLANSYINCRSISLFSPTSHCEFKIMVQFSLDILIGGTPILTMFWTSLLYFYIFF